MPLKITCDDFDMHFVVVGMPSNGPSNQYTLISYSSPLEIIFFLLLSILRAATHEIYTFLLISFLFAGVGVTYSFKNTRTMIAGLESVQESREMIDGGSGFYGIMRACELVPYDSAIFISTDKTPEDVNLVKYAAITLLKKRIRVCHTTICRFNSYFPFYPTNFCQFLFLFFRSFTFAALFDLVWRCKVWRREWNIGSNWWRFRWSSRTIGRRNISHYRRIVGKWWYGTCKCQISKWDQVTKIKKTLFPPWGRWRISNRITFRVPKCLTFH